MGANSGVDWTDHTINFWWGCTKVGPGCNSCYAESFDKRVGGAHWGHGAPRRKIASAIANLRKMNDGHDAFFAKHGRKQRVFMHSMSDLFDNEVPDDWFSEALYAIDGARNLNFQIVTKRVSLVEKRLAAINFAGWPTNAGLMVTVVDQDEADRDVVRLLKLKEHFGIPWVGASIEPMLGPITFKCFIRAPSSIDAGLEGHERVKHYWFDALTGQRGVQMKDDRILLAPDTDRHPTLDWLVVGCESGHHARDFDLGWAGDIIAQRVGTPASVFIKQIPGARTGAVCKDMALFPPNLQVREYPEALL